MLNLFLATQYKYVCTVTSYSWINLASWLSALSLISTFSIITFSRNSIYPCLSLSTQVFQVDFILGNNELTSSKLISGELLFILCVTEDSPGENSSIETNLALEEEASEV